MPRRISAKHNFSSRTEKIKASTVKAGRGNPSIESEFVFGVKTTLKHKAAKSLCQARLEINSGHEVGILIFRLKSHIKEFLLLLS